MSPRPPIRTVFCAALAALFALPAAADALWTENAEEAMAEAAKEGKDLLIDVTGSDWCVWCQRLDEEVFSKEPFTTQVPKHFVLLKLDYPRDRKLPEAIKKQNAEWKKKLPFSGYPTVFLADAAGKPYAKTGYRRGGAEPYVEHLLELKKIGDQLDQALEKAQKAEGIEKAKLLDQALSPVDPELVMHCYADLVESIVELDAQGEAGLKAKYGAMAALKKVNAAIQGGQFDRAIELADQALKTYAASGQMAQDILFSKSIALYNKKDKPAAKKALEAAIEAAPQGEKAEQIQRIIERVFKDVD
ncbi:MAG: thioredoxin family protein [Candidatus Brocadiia bacterium]